MGEEIVENAEREREDVPDVVEEASEDNEEDDDAILVGDDAKDAVFEIDINEVVDTVRESIEAEAELEPDIERVAKEERVNLFDAERNVGKSDGVFVGEGESTGDIDGLSEGKREPLLDSDGVWDTDNLAALADTVTESDKDAIDEVENTEDGDELKLGKIGERVTEGEEDGIFTEADDEQL